MSGKDAYYNQRDPLPTEPLPELITKMEASSPQPEQSLPQIDNPALLDEQQFQEKIQYIDMVLGHAISILNTAYPAVLDANLPPVDVPDASMKSAIYVALTTHGNISEWMAKTMEEALDSHSRGNIYVNIVQTLKDGAENITEERVLTHMVACLSMVNGASALHIDNTQLENMLNTPFYEEIYAKYQ